MRRREFYQRVAHAPPQVVRRIGQHPLAAAAAGEAHARGSGQDRVRRAHLRVGGFLEAPHALDHAGVFSGGFGLVFIHRLGSIFLAPRLVIRALTYELHELVPVADEDAVGPAGGDGTRVCQREDPVRRPLRRGLVEGRQRWHLEHHIRG